MAMPITTDKLNSPSHSMLHNFQVNVRAYGADPTGSSDSTTAIQNAINAGNPVFMPSGTYKITSAINIKDQTVLIGAGIENTIINNTGSGVAINLGGSSGSEIRSTYMADFKIIDAGSGTDGIYMSYCDLRNVIERIWITGCGQHGIQLYNYCYLTTIRDCHIEQCTSNGIHLEKENSHIIIEGNRINNNAIGIYITDNGATVNSTKVSKNDIESNTSGGLYIHKVDANTTSILEPIISENHFEGNSNYSIKIDSTQSYPNFISGGIITKNFLYATDANHNLIQLDHSGDFWIEGNTFNTGAEATIDAIQLGANAYFTHIGPNMISGPGTYINNSSGMQYDRFGGKLQIHTDSSIGAEAAKIIQDDSDQIALYIKHDHQVATGPMIRFDGDYAADDSTNISTMNGDGTVEGPKNYSSQNGWAFEGMVKINVNGTNYWQPFYSKDTS